MRIDLHAHSTRSDGTDTPAELVQAAVAAGLDVVAITDHDTSSGWSEAARALPAGLRLVPGTEVSCVSDDGINHPVTVHLLAYLYDPTAPALLARQEALQLERRQRLHRLAEKMAADGLPINPDELLASIPPDSSAGRPHIGQALVRAGVVSSVQEAFHKFLQLPQYREHLTKIPVTDAIDLMSAAGGVTVLAHPFAVARDRIVTDEVIAQLAARGLTGVEVAHPDHDQPHRDRLASLAKDLDLLTTGSSDYHGSNKSVRLGQELTDPDVFEALVSKATGSPVIPATQ